MCKVTIQMIVADGAAVGQALENIGAAIQVTDPTLAANLDTAGQAVIEATSGWQTGTPLDDVEDAENAAIAVLNAIPVISPFAPLAAIAFAALNLLIANLQTQPATPTASVASAHTLLTAAKNLHTDSPYYGKATIKHNPFKSVRSNFADTFNEEAVKVGVKTIAV